MNLDPKDWLQIIILLVAATAFVVTSRVWLVALRDAIERLTESIQELTKSRDSHEGRIKDLEWFTGMKRRGATPAYDGTNGK